MKSRRLISILGIGAMAALLSGCSATMYSGASATNDDLYAAHDRRALTNAEIERRAKQIAEEKMAEEARQRELARLDADAQQLGEDELTYSSVLSDSYEDSYERRLKGFSSPSYKMPSSYQNATTSTAMRYASAYDPAFYNVMVMGDQVWVEPKYVSSMFGNWGASVNINLGLWGPSWGWPNSYWGYPYNGYWGNNWGWGPSWGWGWNYPYYGGWGPSWGWGGYYPHHHWGGYHYSKYNDRNTVWGRPRTGSGGLVRPSSMGGSGSTSYRRGSSSYSGTGSSAVSGSSGTSYRRGSSSSGSNVSGSIGTGSSSSNSGNTYRRGSSGSSSGSSYSPGSNNSSSGVGSSGSGSSYRRGSSNSGSSYNSGSSNYNSGSTGYNSGGSSSYRGGGSSGYSGGGSSGGSSGGGGYRR